MLTVSVAIVSQNRPASLLRCLVALGQQFHPSFEVVVVADDETCRSLGRSPHGERARVIRFDEANISQARNLAIAAAAGDIIAFIDDDAVPEPTWLCHLVGPFSVPDVMAVGGYVRGRNGISFQARASTVDNTGAVETLELADMRPVILRPAAGRAIKTEGTNMAFRREAIAALGGFDPSYRFFLDETDLNLRMSLSGLRTAIVPMAQVHHGFEASERRRADRMPLDLHEIGASWAVFLKSHCPPAKMEEAWARELRIQKTRLLRRMTQGYCEPRQVIGLMRGFREGFRCGLGREPSQMRPIPGDGAEFRPYCAGNTYQPAIVSGRVWSRGKLRRRARETAATGRVVTLIRLSPTALYHHVRFHTDGYWEQTGGLFGKSDREQPNFSFWTFEGRIRAERKRVKSLRENRPDM